MADRRPRKVHVREFRIVSNEDMSFFQESDNYHAYRTAAEAKKALAKFKNKKDYHVAETKRVEYR